MRNTIRTMLATAAFILAPFVAHAAPQTTCTTKAKIAVDGTITIHRVCTTAPVSGAPKTGK